MHGGKRGGRRTLICLLAGALLLLALLTAGTVLRMQAGERNFGDAFVSFLSDTFSPGSYAPERDA